MDFTNVITNWYIDNKRDLPWRETKNPYLVWLSEIILQQTQIRQGLPYYNSFVARFPSVFDLAEATEEEVLKLWQGLGYYSRARNLHYTAKYISQELDGVFPSNYKALLKLKGVGDYTASAIASICYEEHAAVVDGNVYRVLSRYFGIDTPINSTEGIKYFKNLAQKLLPKKNIGDYNQALMDFGSKQCKAKNPDCANCPLQQKCVAMQLETIKNLPVKLKKTKINKKYFNFLVLISKNNKTILEQRTYKGIWKNLYQFPLFETLKPLTCTDFKNSPEIKTFLANSNYDFTLYNEKEIVHKLSHQHLYTRFWIVNVDALPKQGINIKNLDRYPVPILISNFITNFSF